MGKGRGETENGQTGRGGEQGEIGYIKTKNERGIRQNRNQFMEEGPVLSGLRSGRNCDGRRRPAGGGNQESWGSKHGQSYEVANGDEIDNEGEKRFIAHMVTVDGADSGGKGITAQVCKVHRPLMSVKKIRKSGERVVFDDEGSYVENKATGERIKVAEEDGEYVLDVWVNMKEARETTFGGQGK